MSGKSLVDQIKHYQKDIERCPDNSERMIRCIQRLYVLPIKVEHLQETGVGRSVNSLRKYKGDVGEAAKALVAKWKAMVAAEESGDETMPTRHEEDKVSIPPPQPSTPAPTIPVKTEHKIDHHSSREKSSSRNHSSDRKKHHSESKLHNSVSKSHKSESKSYSSSNSNKPHDKSNDKSHSSSKKSHSSSNHVSEKKEIPPKNHKSHEDKKRKSDSDESPPHKKYKKHHSHSRNHSSSSKKKEQIKSESEDESSSSEESEVSAAENTEDSNSEREVDEESNNSNSSAESDSSSSSDHRHRSKHKSSLHKNSSHSKHHVKHKDLKDKSKEKEKNKENNHSKSNKHSSSKTNCSPDYNELIKENEKNVKKEKDEFVVPKSIPSTKNVKIERNEDGSIDSESGASFADALLGMDSYSEPKKKKKPSSSSSISNSGSSIKKSKSHSSHSSSSGHTKLESSSKKLGNTASSSSKPKTIDELVEPPELLTKKIKLEALDIDISSTLPEINPNYKPLPHIPENIRRPANKLMTEEEMFTIMTTKNQRTKVYSGNKVYQSTVPSLFSLCIQLLYDNIDAVEYTGGVPYNLLKPLLEKLNADQLYVLEHFNPYLIEDTDELWKFHCNKDFRSQKRQDLETWRELYLRCLEEREKKLQALTANITQSMAKSTPVRQAKLAYVDAVVKPPRNVARKQAKYGTGSSTSSSKNPAKQEIISKAVVGGNTPGVSAKDVVPTPPREARAAAHHPTPTILKKKKAPLMQKALQVMKGTRYKR